MSEPRRRRRSGRPLGTGVLVHSLLLIAIAIWSGQSVLAQQVATSATLNDPSSATSTPSKGNGVNSNSTSSPASTSVVSVPLSTQSVPYLVKVPQSIATSNGQRDAYFTGCSDSTLVGYVSAQSRVNISTVYSQIDRYNGDSALGNGYTFSAGTLRVVGIGTVGNESYAFNSYTDSTGATTGLLSESRSCTLFADMALIFLSLPQVPYKSRLASLHCQSSATIRTSATVSIQLRMTRSTPMSTPPAVNLVQGPSHLASTYLSTRRTKQDH